MFDCLIIGGGVSGVSCALVLGSANAKPFVNDKKNWYHCPPKNINVARCIVQ